MVDGHEAQCIKGEVCNFTPLSCCAPDITPPNHVEENKHDSIRRHENHCGRSVIGTDKNGDGVADDVNGDGVVDDSDKKAATRAVVQRHVSWRSALARATAAAMIAFRFL